MMGLVDDAMTTVGKVVAVPIELGNNGLRGLGFVVLTRVVDGGIVAAREETVQRAEKAKSL